MFVEIAIVLIPSGCDEFVKLAEVVLMYLGYKANARIAANCLERGLVVVRDGSRVSIDLRSAFLDGNGSAYDAKVIIKCLVLAESNGPDRRAT